MAKKAGGPACPQAVPQEPQGPPPSPSSRATTGGGVWRHGRPPTHYAGGSHRPCRWRSPPPAHPVGHFHRSCRRGPPGGRPRRHRGRPGPDNRIRRTTATVAAVAAATAPPAPVVAASSRGRPPAAAESHRRRRCRPHYRRSDGNAHNGTSGEAAATVRHTGLPPRKRSVLARYIRSRRRSEAP